MLANHDVHASELIMRKSTGIPVRLMANVKAEPYLAKSVVGHNHWLIGGHSRSLD